MKKAYIYFLCFLNANFGYSFLLSLGLGLGIFLILELWYGNNQSMINILIGFSLVPLAIVTFSFLKEYISVYLLFRNGIKKPGKVIDIRTFRISGYLTYEYDFHDQTYRANAIILKGRVKWFQSGQNVLVTLDPHKPNRAFLEEVYS